MKHTLDAERTKTSATAENETLDAETPRPMQLFACAFFLSNQ